MFVWIASWFKFLNRGINVYQTGQGAGSYLHLHKNQTFSIGRRLWRAMYTTSRQSGRTVQIKDTWEQLKFRNGKEAGSGHIYSKCKVTWFCTCEPTGQEWESCSAFFYTVECAQMSTSKSKVFCLLSKTVKGLASEPCNQELRELGMFILCKR